MLYEVITLVIGGIALTLLSLIKGGLRNWNFNYPLILLTSYNFV